jgi:integrase
MSQLIVIDKLALGTEQFQKAAKNLREWELILAKKPLNTQRAIKSDIADYQIFCDRFNLPYFTTDFELAKGTYTAYVDELANSDLKRATIDRRLASLSVVMKVMEIPNPYQVSKIVQEYVDLTLRAKPKAQKQAAPLRIEDLEFINANFEIAKAKDLRDLLAINFSFSALLRGSELCAIEHKHINTRDNTLFIPVRKNDQDGEGGYSYLSDYCLNLYQLWTKESGTRSGYVFRAMNKGGNVLETPMKYRTFYDAFKHVLVRCGMDPQGYSTHSGRVGAVSSMAEAGMDNFEIQLSGGWKDPKMPAKYAKQAQMKNAGIAKLLKNRG